LAFLFLNFFDLINKNMATAIAKIAKIPADIPPITLPLPVE
jgi:hypothetical protein